MARTREALARGAGSDTPSQPRDRSSWFVTAARDDRGDDTGGAGDGSGGPRRTSYVAPPAGIEPTTNGGVSFDDDDGAIDPLDLPAHAAHRMSLRASAASIAEAEARRRGETAWRHAAGGSRVKGHHPSEMVAAVARGALSEEELARASFLSRYAVDADEMELARRRVRRAELRSHAAACVGCAEESALCVLAALAPLGRCALAVRDGAVELGRFIRSNRGKKTSTYPGITGTHSFTPGAGRRTKDHSGRNSFAPRFSFLDCLAGVFVDGPMDGSGAHGFSGGRGAGIGAGGPRGWRASVLAYVRASRTRRRILGGVVLLVFVVMLLAAVDAVFLGSRGVIWGDGVPDARTGDGVGVGNYRGGGTVVGAALRGLNYPVRLAGGDPSDGGGGGVGALVGWRGGGNAGEFAVLAAFREAFNGPSERSDPAWWRKAVANARKIPDAARPTEIAGIKVPRHSEMWTLRERHAERRHGFAGIADGVVRTDGDRAAAMPRGLHPQASAPSVAVTPSGAVLVAYVSGDAEGAEGASIVVARLAPGRGAFEPTPRVVARLEGRAMGPPSIFATPGVAGAGVVTVLFTSTPAFGSVRGNRLAGVRSLDDGVSWLDVPEADLPSNLRSLEVHAPPVQVGCFFGGVAWSGLVPRELPWGVENGPGFVPVTETFGGGSFHGVNASCATWILPMHRMPRGALERSSPHSGFAYTTDGGRRWRYNEEGRWAKGQDGFGAATVGACARKRHLVRADRSDREGRPGGAPGGLAGMAASAASAASAMFRSGSDLLDAGVEAASAAAGLGTLKSPEECRPRDVGAQSPLAALPFHAGALVSPALVRLRSGAIAAFFASTAGDRVYRAESTDEAATWSYPEPTSLPSNGAPVAVAALRDTGKVVAVFNNARGLDDRWPLSIALSDDGGLTWRAVRDLEPVGATVYARRRAATKRRFVSLRRRGLLDVGAHRRGGSPHHSSHSSHSSHSAGGGRRRFDFSGRKGDQHVGATSAADADIHAEADALAAEAHASAVAAAERVQPEANALVSMGRVSMDGQLLGPHGSGITPQMVRDGSSAGHAAGGERGPPVTGPAERYGGKETRYFPIDTGGGPAAPKRHRGEFSYPSVAQSTDGSIHVVYSVLREAVQYVRVHESWIARGPTSAGAFRGDYHVEPEEAAPDESTGGDEGEGGGGDA